MFFIKEFKSYKGMENRGTAKRVQASLGAPSAITLSSVPAWLDTHIKCMVL